MNWRKHDTNQQETTAVRKALRSVGINARVSHGRGTSYAWLKVNIGAGQQWGEHERRSDGFGCERRSCRRCTNLAAIREQTGAIVREVTGRRGDYNGDTSILQQDHWNQAKGRSEPIDHPNWKGASC